MEKERGADTVSRLLDELVECEREAAAVQARSLGLLAKLHRAFGEAATGVAFRSPDQLQYRSMRLEIASALRVGERTVDARLDLAFRLTEQLPATLVALQEGRITERHARVMAAELTELDDDVRAELEARLLPGAERDNPARFAQTAADARERVDPRTACSRHERAVAERAIWVSRAHDGMSTLQLHTDAVSIEAIFDRVTRAAASMLDETPEDDRTLAQARTDLAAKVLLGSDLLTTRKGPIVPTVALTVPVLSLLGASDEPAVLNGRTPIDRATAAGLIGDATSFARVLTDPITDAAIAFDPGRYRITGAHRQFLQVRWGGCGMVGCGMPADRCDIDHLRGWAQQGRSTDGKLWPVCRGHHSLKTFAGWTPAATAGGSVTWTSPLGREYAVAPRQRTGPPIHSTAPPGPDPAVDPGPPPPRDDTELERDAAEAAIEYERAAQDAAASLAAIEGVRSDTRASIRALEQPRLNTRP